MRTFAILLSALALAGCQHAPELPAVISPYKIDIQQGNVVTQEMVAKLKPGMTRAQVRFALGSPLIVDPFHTDRWDYVYLYQKQGQEAQRRRVTVIFDADKLARIEGDVVPSATSVTPPVAGKPPGKLVAQPPAAGGSQAETAKTDAARDEKPTQDKGFFGKILEKIGF